MIAILNNTEALIGEQATKAEILQQLPQARLIHLATHGLLDDVREFGIPGAIALAPADDDGFLTSGDLMEMFGLPGKAPLIAKLAVLSACSTGLGRITGDGVVGLSRSWLAAGVPSLVVSLWEVDDLSTTFLMIKFYDNLLAHKSVAQALKEAQSWLRNVTKEELKQYVKQFIRNLIVDKNQKGNLREKLIKTGTEPAFNQISADTILFESPYYWAAFIVIGQQTVHI